MSSKTAALLRDVDRCIAQIEPQNSYRLYELLHSTARLIAPVEAFYICLYSAPDAALFFPYNVDGDVYDPPVTVPLGNGPTSQVVRTGQSVVWNDEASARSVGGIMFGQTERYTLSAAHVPIRSHDGEPTVLGVLSAQCYQAGAYDPEAVAAFQRLADRAGVVLRREWDEAAWRYRLRVAEFQQMDQKRPLVEMADEFVAILQDLTRRAEALDALVSPGDAALAEAVTGLHRACRRAQTQANQLPLRPHLSPAPTPPLPAAPSPLDALTPTQREVLALMASGKSNPQIADALCVSTNTVKDHCRAIFERLNVTTRTQAAVIHTAHAPA